MAVRNGRIIQEQKVYANSDVLELKNTRFEANERFAFPNWLASNSWRLKACVAHARRHVNAIIWPPRPPHVEL
jgi:hypothetical protein